MTDEDFEPELIEHFIDAADPGTHDGFYALKTLYWETDALNAQGQIYWLWIDPDGADLTYWDWTLNTNDALECLWASPEGNLWVGSRWGRVWTTADVPWDNSSVADVDWEQADPHFTWKGTLAPIHPRHEAAPGFGYNIAGIWCSSDSDVYFCTFDGDIMHWDGSQFRIVVTENDSSLIRMHGTGPNDVWAVGRDGIVLHNGGAGFRQVPLPDELGEGEVLTGVWALSPQEVYICSTSGKIFRGSPHGLERVGDYPASFYGVVGWQDRLILAGGETGPMELRGNKLIRLRDTFAATAVYTLGKRLGFVEPAQDRARVIVHDPTQAKPWAGWVG